jgi:hypothetical protein
MTYPLATDPVTALRTGLAATIEQAGITSGGEVHRGKSIIATSESRTNTAYGLLTTPDRVQNVVLPADGLLVVAFQALWEESVPGASRAALFIGADQLKVPSAGSAGPVTQAAATDASFAATFVRLVTTPAGLVSYRPSASIEADAATPQVVGLVTYASGVPMVMELNGSVHAPVGGPTDDPTFSGGQVLIEAAAGTYDISVQFKASSGSVTVKNRKLWVWTLGF